MFKTFLPLLSGHASYMLLVSLALRSRLRKRAPGTLSIGINRSGVFGDEINPLCRRWIKRRLFGRRAQGL